MYVWNTVEIQRNSIRISLFFNVFDICLSYRETQSAQMIFKGTLYIYITHLQRMLKRRSPSQIVCNFTILRALHFILSQLHTCQRVKDIFGIAVICCRIRYFIPWRCSLCLATGIILLPL